METSKRVGFYTVDGVEYLRRRSGPDIRIASSHQDFESGLDALDRRIEQ